MSNNWFAHAAACALIVASSHVAADAKSKRPTTSTARKAAAAKAEAAKKESARLAVEAAAKAAAEAAEKARVRAQWGLLADIGEADFQTRDALPVTVRKNGEAFEMTAWTSVMRGVVRFERNASTGAMTLSVPGQWSRKSYPARVMQDGSIEATAKNESRWTALARDPEGGFILVGAPGGKMKFDTLVPGSKADTKIASLVAAGKVSAAGAASKALQTAAGAQMTGTALSLPTAGGSGGETARQHDVRLDVASGNTVEGVTDKNDRGEGFGLWRIPCIPVRASAGDTLRLDAGTYGERSVVIVRYDCQDSAIIASADNAGHRGDLSLVLQQGSKPIFVQFYKRGQGKKYRLALTKLTDAQAAEWKRNKEQARLAEIRRKNESGNSGWLGGLIMGGVAAAAGGDAGMVMGAAMKGVEMTTDNEMTRNVLAGKGDEMIQSSVDLQNQKVELERLRVAAEEETRRKREAEDRAAVNARAQENAKRVAEANARQQAIADDFASRQATNDKAKSESAAQAETARAKRLAEQEQRDEEAHLAERAAAATAERDKRAARADAEAEKRRAAEAQRLAELKRKQEEVARPIAMREGIVLCAKQRENYYRCEGPLQVTYSDLKSPAGMTSIREACGSNTPRDMGMAASFRVFGCGFGINPHSDSPGNRDVPAAYGLFVDGRATFYCPRSKDAYCRAG